MNYYIATRNHESLWPRGVILWWGEGSCGYSSTLEGAGEYTESNAKDICTEGSANLMVPCSLAKYASVTVVDIDILSGWEHNGVAR